VLYGLIPVTRKRLQLHVRELSWLVTLLLFVLLFSGSFRNSLRAYEDRMEAFEADQMRHLRETPDIPQTYVQLRMAVDRRPMPLQVHAPGAQQDFGSCAVVRGRFGATTIEARAGSTGPAQGALAANPMQVTGLFGSLLAVLVSCSSIPRERESGMMQVLLTWPVRRATFLAGEYLAAMTVIVGPLLLCLLATLIVFGFHPMLEMNAETAAGLVGLAILILLLVSFFVSVGLLIASRARSSATSVTIGFSLWVLLTVLHPNIAAAMARLIVPAAVAPDLSGSYTLVEYASESFHAERRAREERAVESSLAQRVRQADVHTGLSLLSPYSVFLLGAERIAGSGVTAHQHFLQTVARSDADLQRWQDGKLALYPTRARLYNVSDGPLDMEGMPPSVVVAQQGGLDQVLPFAGLLVLLNGIALFAAHTGLKRYDPRPA
jgi:ABC-type transport system involved in multi-copper enzyme maturation permease subunit